MLKWLSASATALSVAGAVVIGILTLPGDLPEPNDNAPQPIHNIVQIEPYDDSLEPLADIVVILVPDPSIDDFVDILVPNPRVTPLFPSFLECEQQLRVTAVVRDLENDADVPFELVLKRDCEDEEQMPTPMPPALGP